MHTACMHACMHISCMHITRACDMHNITMMPAINCALSSRIQEIIMILVMQGNLQSPATLSSSKSPAQLFNDPLGASPGPCSHLFTPCKLAPPASSHRENFPLGSALPPKKLILAGVPRGAAAQFCTPAPFAAVCRCLSRCAALLFK